MKASSWARRSAVAALAVLEALLLACPSHERATAPPRDGETPPNLLLVTLDTTRADHLGCYGYGPPTTPNLDRLCQDAEVHERAYSTSSWTLPSHGSLFTGQYTASHGARYDPDGPLVLGDALDVKGADQYRARGLDPEASTLAAILTEAGWTTAGIVAGPWMKRVFGLDRGFTHWDDSGIDVLEGRSAASVTDAALAWLDGAPEPWLLFLNYYDPHAPYEAPPAFRATLERAGPSDRDREPDFVLDYDAEIRYMDHHLGRLLDTLRRQGRLLTTWVVVTADHGELLGEHGHYGHGVGLWEAELRIPLVVRPPGGLGTAERPTRPISLADLMPRLLGELGLEMPADLLRMHEMLGDGRVLAELYPYRSAGHWKALVEGPYKMLSTPAGRTLLFDVGRDPDESRNLALEAAERAQRMAGSLDALLEALPARPEGAGEAEARPVDPETRRALQELGYLE